MGIISREENIADRIEVKNIIRAYFYKSSDVMQSAVKNKYER